MFSNKSLDDRRTLQELTVQSPNRDVLPFFERTRNLSARTTSSEPNQMAFSSAKKRLEPVLPPQTHVGHQWRTPTRTKCLTPPLLPEVLDASSVSAVTVTVTLLPEPRRRTPTRGSRRTKRRSLTLRSSPSCACWRRRRAPPDCRTSAKKCATQPPSCCPCATNSHATHLYTTHSSSCSLNCWASPERTPTWKTNSWPDPGTLDMNPLTESSRLLTRKCSSSTHVAAEDVDGQQTAFESVQLLRRDVPVLLLVQARPVPPCACAPTGTNRRVGWPYFESLVSTLVKEHNKAVDWVRTKGVDTNDTTKIKSIYWLCEHVRRAERHLPVSPDMPNREIEHKSVANGNDKQLLKDKVSWRRSLPWWKLSR